MLAMRRRLLALVAFAVLVLGALGCAGAREEPSQARAAQAARATRMLDDATAATRVRRSGFEPRPENWAANHRVPTAAELAAFRARNQDSAYKWRVTGRFTGTTDEILQWAARKWGLDPDLVRAVAATESRWRMSLVGDAGQSFGILQLKRTVHAGTYPLSARSTAFNADYWGSIVRTYLDGRGGWLNRFARGRPYRAGDIWGSIGVHFAGRWYTRSAQRYIDEVKRNLAQRPWLDGHF
jgi:hypothetical protein